MVIKNKDELVDRARKHRDLDHLIRGTYGRGRVNGTLNGTPIFKGCAIGCLAAPAEPEELDAYLRSDSGFAEERYPATTIEGITLYEMQKNSDDQIEEIEEQFGVCRALVRWAEHYFENTDLSFEESRDFVVEFCEALPEGEDIDDEYVGRHYDGGWRRQSTIAGPHATKDGYLAWLHEGCPAFEAVVPA
jgi:hypothetical protein